MIPRPVKIGVGGPVGSGKTALVWRLCRALRDRVELAVITNDIYTRRTRSFSCAAALPAIGWSESRPAAAPLGDPGGRLAEPGGRRAISGAHPGSN